MSFRNLDDLSNLRRAGGMYLGRAFGARVADKIPDLSEQRN